MAARRTKGTGSIDYDDKKRTYRGRIKLKGKTYTVYAQSKTATQTKLNAIIAAGGKPTPAGHPVTATGDTGQTVAELVKEWQAKDLASRDRSPGTVARIGFDAKHVTKWIGTIPVAELTTRQVETMLEGMAGEGLARITCSKALNTLSQSLKWACRRGELSGNVAEYAVIPASAPRTKVRNVLTPDDARTLLEALRGQRNGLMFAMSLRLGLRPGEAAGLHWDDISINANGVTLINVTRAARTVQGVTEIVDDLKTSSAKRTIAAPPDISAWINEHRKAQNVERLAAKTWVSDQIVFTTNRGTVLTPPRTRKQLTAICTDAGIEPVTPNELRHSCASLLADMGVANEEIADLLGHTTTRMVDQTYRHRLRPTVDVAVTADWVTG
jgi:integrase